ncbi:hypothetical protein [Prosthecobacter dejongeii]|uniref:Uncharacterized protein n=1 Tax=Prosthecobacter dejongeii TaxID=48465 RepID=A0A7W7YMM1_9BACT|nr:hypothetical protein [Prosthecobacter dejongeii]MBB5039008.1 hypothetical protein [Prosthecobacter dejongeii]
MRRFQAVLAQRVESPEQPILPEFLPLMKELDAVLEAPAFQATRPASTYGSVKEGETTLAYYGTRLNAEGQLDLLIQLSDDRQYLRSLPPVTPEDVQAKITELENTIRHSQAQAESARARLSGPSLAAMGPGAMGAANGALAEIEHAEQKVQQAKAEQQKLAAQGPRYLLDQRVREELKKPEWEGLVGTYNAGEEILKGLARAGLHANALVTRLFGEENGLNQAGGHLSESLGIPHAPVTLQRLNAAEQALDTALPGSTRRRLEGGTWNQAVLGLQQGAGYMAPGLLGGWGVSLAARGTTLAARVAAGRIGVAGGSSFITAAGGSYVQTEGLIQQALADNNPARAQQLAKYRDAHALLTGLTELAIERFSPLHKMTPNGMHGIAKNAVDMGKEVAENPLTSLLQQNVLDRGLLGTPGYDWNNLPAELLTSLMTAGLLKSGQKGIERLAGGSAAPVSTQAPLETPPIEEAPATQAGAANLTDTLSQEANTRSLMSSQDTSAPGSALPAGVPSPQRQQIDSVVTRLQQQAPGLVHDRTLIFSNEAEALASDYAQQHPFTDKARAEMQGKEGFFDITTGSTVILANNVRRRAWETESQALTRTIIRHRIGYDGLSILFGNNKGDVKKTDPHTPGYQRWVEFSAQIPRTELDAIARDKAYRHLDGDPEALKLAWFAREVENTPSPEAMRPLARQMWDFLSDLVGKLFVKAGLRDARTPGFNDDLKDYIFLARDAALKNGGQTPQSIATSSTSGRTGRPLLSTTLRSDGMPADTASRITSLWKPHRPDPADYLPEKRTQEHLELFKGGVSKIMKALDYETHSPLRDDGTTFVMPTWQLEAILDYAKGDRVKLETALGMEPGEYKGAALVRVDFTGPETYKLVVPSGNEDGANTWWIPGGLLPKVPDREPIPEATLDLRGRTDKPWTKTPLNL